VYFCACLEYHLTLAEVPVFMQKRKLYKNLFSIVVLNNLNFSDFIKKLVFGD